ncbi:MAG: DUF4062 domain-containing protein, partial [Nitrosopumilus sp.]
MNKKYQVFISSTYRDLKEERQAAVEAILKAGHIPAGMELFTSGNVTQMETIKRWIDESDIFLLILGGRYGSVEGTTSLSYVELEYDYVLENEIPFFAVVINEEALEKKVKKYGTGVVEMEHQNELKDFREKVLSKQSSFFDDVKDIKLTIYETIPTLAQSNILKGWVSGNDVPNVDKFLSEIDRLTEKNKEQTDINRELKKQMSNSQNGVTDFDKLVKILKEIKVSTVLFNDEGDDEKREITLLNIFIATRDLLIIGISNRYGMSNLRRFLY